MMNKVSDPKLFSGMKVFLTVYLPRIRARSPHTVQAHKDALNLFLQFLKAANGIELRKVTSADFNSENVLSYLDWLKTERGCADSTRNQRLMSIRVFSKYLASEDMLAFDAYSKIQAISRLPVPEQVLENILSIDDIKLILEMPDATTRMGLRDQFYMALLYDTGCRNDEILSLALGDIVPGKDGGKVNIIGKGRKFRVTPLSKEIVTMLRQYASVFHPECNPQKHLFYITRKGVGTSMSADNTARILRKYEAMAKVLCPNIPHLHAHYFRHVRAMHLYQAGMPLPLIGQWLGHSQLETTLIYSYADTEMKRAAADKVNNSRSLVFSDEQFMFQDDDATIKKLYGLA
jgi:site-specific recombinase XerD